ncbi:hypothetical protein SEA_BONUM_5 [Gordonia phage Bonum]|uniref:Uncharacterized protein n=1 Tax=Gordonia phage Kabluna TaxID=2041511 RepID=A0A2D1GCH2_9CAUD|nr:hypothetical protein KNT75_gp05 [Gordonia phage Kabluna]ATN89526.1 hypothetical protein SEA_KABLUNA_5 [Gordonia phage Kabluna]QXN73310.1 hypothetical protein SEA_BONUM_5 [Gordonia phage Bonum]
MSARVEENVLYYASCVKCQWYSEDFDSREAARREAKDHNDEEHNTDE